MNLPHTLQQLEQGSISAAQAEQEIRDEIERALKIGETSLLWKDAIETLKAALGLLTEIEK